MAQRQSAPDLRDAAKRTDGWSDEPWTPIDINDDLRAAARRAAMTEQRQVVRDGDEELAAIVSMDDFRLLLRLEEAELDRIDIEEARQALADPDNQESIPLAQIRAELGL